VYIQQSNAAGGLCKKGIFAVFDVYEWSFQALRRCIAGVTVCKTILSCVPYAAKADAVKKTLESDLTNQVPATMLKTHSNFHLFLDKDSAAKVADKI
jgi:glucosamine-6-phosphate deaminase